MESFSSMVVKLDDIIWSMFLVCLCLGVGFYLSVKLKFPQVRLLTEMVRLLFSDKGTEQGISSFQAFATTVGARVGMGNIAGVATAIYVGGPGAIFWMWIITIIGAASAFTEATLAQAYKNVTKDGVFVGGPAYYIEKGMKNRTYAIIFAVVAVLGPGILMPGVQINSLVTVFEEAFGVEKIITGVVCCVILAFVVFGSIKRISRLAEILAPVMCMIYIGLAVIIIGLHISEVPAMLMLIVKSAVGMEPLLAGIIGSAVSWGVKRGIYSNEAGMGCGAIVSAAAACSHPGKQGLIQAFSIYVDTLLVGTATAMIVLLTGTFDISDGHGGLLVNNINGMEAGIKWTQHALMATYGDWAGQLLAIIIVLFVFTSLTGYCYQAEANMSFLTGDSPKAAMIIRAAFVVAAFCGTLVNADAIWALGDIGYGLMAYANIFAIVLLAPLAKQLLDDYEAKKAAGKDPDFAPEEFGIADYTGAWKK